MKVVKIFIKHVDLKRFILFFLALGLTFFAFSQELSSHNKKALKYYNNAVLSYRYQDFNQTIINLNKSIKHDSNFIDAWLLLGDAYVEVDSSLKAIVAYKTARYIDSLYYPSVNYFLGNLYYRVGDYEKSVESYQLAIKQKSISPEMLKLAQTGLKFASTAYYLIEHPSAVDVVNIGSPINTKNDEYINYVNTESDFLMLTRRSKFEKPAHRRKLYSEELLFTDKLDSIWENPAPINLSWKGDLDMGSLNLSTDGRTIYFTGCYWPGGVGGCDLYQSKSLGDNWLYPRNLGANINSSSWDSQPIISSDNNKIYFASKRKGGKGGSDIWMSVKLKNNSWSPPINLGDSINTSKDEIAPFLHADGTTLYFASNGHPGLGGYDLFISRKDDVGRWSEATNLGYPVNSKYNDINIFVSIDGAHSYISSDRVGGKGKMDIYHFSNYPQIRPNRVMYIEGYVYDKETDSPLQAKIDITDLYTSKVVNTAFSDSLTGKFLIVIYPGIDYAFNISKKGYLFLSENITVKDSIQLQVIKKQFYLAPFKSGNKLVMNNIFFKTDDYSLLPESNVELNKLLRILSINSKYDIEIFGHTDNIGSKDYNNTLSLKRAQEVGKYLIMNGISAKRLSYKGMGFSNPVATNDTEIGRAKNRRVEISIK